jgi:hypothetical protein
VQFVVTTVHLVSFCSGELGILRSPEVEVGTGSIHLDQ